jgi:hypothetical protein
MYGSPARYRSPAKYGSPARYATADRHAHNVGSIVKEVIYVYVCTSFPKEGLEHKQQHSPLG